MRGYTKDTKIADLIDKYEQDVGSRPLYAIVPVGYKVDGEITYREASNTQAVFLDHEPIKWKGG